MLVSLFQAIVNLANKANSVEPFKVEGVRDKTFLRNGEDIEEYYVQPLPRNGEVRGIADLVRYVTDKAVATDPEIYFNTSGASAFLDRSDRVESVQMPFRETERMATMRSLLRGVELNPSEAVKFLKFRLNDSGAGVIKLQTALSKVDFQTMARSSRAVRHGSDSMGKEVEAKVSRAEEIDEFINVAVPVWSNPGLKSICVKMCVGIHLNASAETVEFRLLADQLPEAIERALQQVHDVLEKALESDKGDIPVFCGNQA